MSSINKSLGADYMDYIELFIAIGLIILITIIVNGIQSIIL